MVTHVIKGNHYILGEGGGGAFFALNLTGSHHFSFSKDQIKTFTFMNTGVHFIKKVTS
jgi:hypothetical protein